MTNNLWELRIIIEGKEEFVAFRGEEKDCLLEKDKIEKINKNFKDNGYKIQVQKV